MSLSYIFSLLPVFLWKNTSDPNVRGVKWSQGVMLAVLLSPWKFQDSLPCSTSLIRDVLDKTKEHKLTISFRVLSFSCC